MKKFLVSVLALLALPSTSLAQGGPDVYWDNSLAGVLGGNEQRYGWGSLAMAPTGAQSCMVMDYVYEPLLLPSTQWKVKFTVISQAGVHVHAPVSLASRQNGHISRTGQMAVYHERYSTGSMRDGVMMSLNYGQTFSPLALPTSPTYTVYGDNGLNSFGGANNAYFSSVIGEDDKFYLLYFTTKPAGAVNLDRYELNLLTVDAGGVATHSVISRVSAAGPITSGFINVVATQNAIVAVVRPGQLVTPRGGTTSYINIPMAVVIDCATQAVQKISYGGTLGSPLSVRQRYESGLSAINSSNSTNLRMLTSDGQGVFMVNGATILPAGRVPLRVREFPYNASRYAGFFVNSEQSVPGYVPSWQPYMELSSAAMDYGTWDTGFVGTGVLQAGGVTLDVVSKWAVAGVSDHSVDFCIRSPSDSASGVYPIRRVRIRNPNSPPSSFPSETVEDVRLEKLWGLFGGLQSYYELSHPSFIGVEGAVASTFAYASSVDGWGVLWFRMHATDFS